MKNLIKISILSLISVIGLSSAVFSATLTKTFEFGEGTANTFSHRRTFAIPCRSYPKTTVKFSRLGKPGTDYDLPLTITLIKPSESGDEGEIAATQEVKAKTTVQTVTVGDGRETSDLGCSKMWSVRVKATNDTSSVRVSGEIQMTYSDTVKDISPSDNINLNSGNSVEVNFGVRSNIGQGVIEVKGEWYHNLGLVPILLKMTIIDPNGKEVATENGYAQNEIRNVTKLKIVYRVQEFIPGTWKLKITNASDGHDAVRIKPIAIFKPSCP